MILSFRTSFDDDVLSPSREQLIRTILVKKHGVHNRKRCP